MNRKILIFSVFLFFTFFFGCGGDDNVTEPDSLRIAKDLQSINFNEKKNEGVFGVLTNTGWSLAVSGGTWISCTPSSGEGNSTVVITVDPNKDAQSRTASITITSQSGKLDPCTITVSQIGTEPAILISPTKADVLAEGGDIEVTVTATNTFTKQLPDGGWVSEKPQVGDKVVLNVKPNDGDDERTGTVTFFLNASDKKASLVITQPCIPWILPTVKLPAEASVGTSIAITGTDLQEITEVWFGTTKGVIVEAGRTGTAMTVTIPETATQGLVNVKIVFGAKGRERTVGSMTLLSPQPVVNNLPASAQIGQVIQLTGVYLDRIDDILFGGVKGNIIAGGSAISIKVTVPSEMIPGTYEVTIIYDGTKSKLIGNIQLIGFDPTINLAKYAGSSLPNVPAVTTGSANSGNRAQYAFDEVYSVEAYDNLVAAFPPNGYLTLYSNISGLAAPARNPTTWQANNACVPGVISNGVPAPTGTGAANAGSVWITLNYSVTTAGSVTFDKIVLYARDNNGDTQEYEIEYSDDNLNWTKIVKAENSTPLNSTTIPRMHNDFGTVTAKYVRYVGVKHRTVGSGNLGLTGFEIYRTK